jgi:hypothetical protein
MELLSVELSVSCSYDVTTLPACLTTELREEFKCLPAYFWKTSKHLGSDNLFPWPLLR